MSSIDKRLDAALSKMEITELLYRYCRAIERCDEQALRSVYHCEAIELHGIYDGPADGFIPFVLDAVRRTPQGSHHVTNILIDIEGNTASSEACFISISSGVDDGLGQAVDLLLTGRYLDRLERRDDEWKITRRKVVFDTSQILPAAADWTRPLTASCVPHGEKDRTDALYQLLDQR